MSENDLVHVMMKWQETFDNHTREELERYNTIMSEIRISTQHDEESHKVLSDKIDKLANNLKEHADAVKGKHEEVSTQLHQAIPDKDFVGHGRIFIKNKNDLMERRIIALETKKKIVSGTVIGGLLILGYALLEYFKIWIHTL